jgi:hypothetical protein
MTFPILRRIRRDIINAYRSSCKVSVILVRCERDLYVLNRFYEKLSNVEFHENMWSGIPVVQCGQTDGRTNLMQLIDTFHDCAKKPKNL